MSPTLARVVLPLLLLGALAHAEPAVIKVFEARVHAQPDTSAPILHTFPEKAEVSVSEEAQAGWRRVRLPDGQVGWIQESTLALRSTAAAPAPAPPSDTPLRQPQAPAARIYVKDLDHLAELVKEDPIVAPQAQSLASRATAAKVFIIGGVVTGVTLGTLGVVAGGEECSKPIFQNAEPFCMKKIDMPLLFTGVGLTVLGPLVGLLVAPGHGSLLDVINSWNTRHPEQPFDLDNQPSR